MGPDAQMPQPKQHMSDEEASEYMSELNKTGGKNLKGIEAEVYNKLWNQMNEFKTMGDRLTKMTQEKEALTMAIQQGTAQYQQKKGNVDALAQVLIDAETTRRYYGPKAVPNLPPKGDGASQEPPTAASDTSPAPVLPLKRKGK